MVWPFKKKKDEGRAMALATLASNNAPAAPSGGLMRYADTRAEGLRQHGVRSLLDRGLTFTGTLESDKGAVLDGTINGDLIVTDANAALLLRAGSKVTGTVRAPIVLIGGEVEGEVEGRFVRIYPGAVVRGRIRATRLIVEDGATVETEAISAGTPKSPVILDLQAARTPAAAG